VNKLEGSRLILPVNIFANHLQIIFLRVFALRGLYAGQPGFVVCYYRARQTQGVNRVQQEEDNRFQGSVKKILLDKTYFGIILSLKIKR
jgi:hypothetical protein